MATQAVIGQGAWFGAYDLASYARTLALDYGAELQDDTRLSDTMRKRVAGVFNCGFSFETVDDPTVEAGLHSAVGTADVPLTVAPNGGAAIGDLAYILRCLAASSTPIAGAHGEAGKVNVAGFGEPLARGVIIRNTTVTATSTGSTYDYGSVPSGTAYIAIHVYQFSGAGSIDTITLRSSTDPGFGTATAVAQLSSSTTANRYAFLSGVADERYWHLRVAITGTVSARVVCAFGIIED